MMAFEEKRFYAQFEEEVREIIVLVKENCSGAWIDGDYMVPSVSFIAAIDPETNEMEEIEGQLKWIITKDDSDREDHWGYTFNKMTIYKVLARKCIEQEVKPPYSPIINNRYCVVKILETMESESRLDKLRFKYLKPVSIIEKELGEFSLDRAYSWFDGKMKWNGNEVNVLLNTDEDGGETVHIALNKLKEIVKEAKEWNRKIRAFAAEELTGLANEWNEESDEPGPQITKKALQKGWRLKVSVSIMRVVLKLPF